MEYQRWTGKPHHNVRRGRIVVSLSRVDLGPYVSDSFLVRRGSVRRKGVQTIYIQFLFQSKLQYIQASLFPVHKFLYPKELINLKVEMKSKLKRYEVKEVNFYTYYYNGKRFPIKLQIYSIMYFRKSYQGPYNIRVTCTNITTVLYILYHLYFWQSCHNRTLFNYYSSLPFCFLLSYRFFCDFSFLVLPRGREGL